MSTLLLLLLLATTDPVLEDRIHVRFDRDALRTETVQQIAARNGIEIDHAILPYEHSLTARREKDASTLQRNDIARALALEEPLLRTFVVRLRDRQIAPELICARLMRGCTGIEIAEPISVAQLCGFTPNDSLISEQPMLATIKAYEAWEIERGSDTIRIGISDSGVKQDHEDLSENIAVNAGEVPDNDKDDDNNGYVDDHRGYSFTSKDDSTKPGDTYNSTEGHGTAVAGICSASTNNGKGIAGVGFNCKIVPLKTMPNGQRGIIYGYESLLYCARNGVSVVNCSWGGFNRSCTDEAVVQYVLARGTAIVAAAGNHGTTAPFYPAGYPGVLGVGVTDPRDTVVGMSALGPGVDVMAPGNETKATSNDGTYGGFCCTSGSAPIVAGVVGLIRSRHPSLSAAQALALARESVDDIRDKNPRSADLVPGRINAFKAVTLDPDSTPGILVTSTTITNRRNAMRYGLGDTIDVLLTVRNELAAIGPITATTSVVRDPSSSVRLLTPTFSTSGLKAGEERTLPPITLVVDRASDTTIFLRTEVSGTPTRGGTYTSVLLASVTPAPSYVDLANDVLRLSVGDHVRIGNTDPERGQGNGVSYRAFCGMLAEGGLVIGSHGRVVSSIRSQRGVDDHFVPSKPFIDPDALRGIATDAAAPDSMRLHLQIDQRVRVAAADSGLFVSDMTFTNIGDSILYDVGIAWFFDWDLGSQPASNVTSMAQQTASPSSVVQTVSAQGGPYVACSASSPWTTSSPIACGLDNTTTYRGISAAFKDSLLRSGTSLQYQNANDVSILVGTMFNGAWHPNEVRTVRLAIAIDTVLARAIDLAASVVPPASTATLTVGAPFPLPASSHVNVPLTTAKDGTVVLRVYDLQGRLMVELSMATTAGALDVPLDVRAWASGSYTVVVASQGAVVSAPLMVLR